MSSIKWLSRWSGALIGLTLGTVDTAILMIIGGEVVVGGRDVTLLVGGYFAVNFAILGFLLGLSIESRVRERAAQQKLQEQEQRLNVTQKRLAQNDKLAALGQMASSMAHELRNPLAIIRSTVQNLNESFGQHDAEAREACQFVLEEIDRASRVTSEIVRFARPVEPRRSRLRADELHHRSRALAERLLNDRPVRLEARPANSNASLNVDPDLICQALLGLIDNAAQVTPPGGVIAFEAVETKGGVEFSVLDSGPGIPEEHRKRLFEPFFTTRKEGAGLGLAVAKQIAEAHGGRIDVSERPEGGARFSLKLPLSDEAA